MTTLPTGTVTFLFSDIEGSTQLWQDHPEAMPSALARHHAIVRDAIESEHGHVFQIVGDGFCAAFAMAPDALVAALEIQRRLLAAAASFAGTGSASGEASPAAIRVRIGLHSGAAESRDREYLSNPTLIRVQRVMAAGHGGQILLSDATETLARDALPAGARLQDMGRHRLKGLLRPEHIFQLSAPGLPNRFPPLHTLDVFPNNLPTPVNSFVGREREIAELKRWLRPSDQSDRPNGTGTSSRLVTLTGVGGTGKTRLALQIASEVLESYLHGVWLIELAPVADHDLVPQAVASALNVREQPGMTLLEALTDHLRAKHLLLVLDNCEHVVEACARLTDTLLRACPQLTILATSREAFGIAGERSWLVPTLSQPDPRQFAPPASAAEAQRADLAVQLSHYESVQLFVDRAKAVHPHFVLTSQNALPVALLCQHLDGIPLAIELAAARLKALSVEQIAARLDDRFSLLTGGSRTALPRQQTLRAAIDWSHDLLSHEERRLFSHLSVFAGGWTLEAAESVCGNAGAGTRGASPSADRAPVIDLLAQLVNKSLVVMDTTIAETRFHFLETIRQYARERLAAAGDAAAVERRHRDYFLRLAGQLEPQLRAADQVACLNRLDTEHDNLWLATDWSLAHGEPLEALRIAGSLQRFFYLRGYWSKGREWLERTLAAAPGVEGTSGQSAPDVLAARAKALSGLGWLSNDSGRGATPYGESLMLFRQIGDHWGTAFALRGMGVTAYNEGRYTESRELLDESLSLFRALGDDWGIGLVQFSQGWLAFEQDNHQQAQTAWEDSLARFRRSADRWGIAVTLGALSYSARLRGEDKQAVRLAQDSLALFRELGDKSGISDSLSRLGVVAYRHEDLKQTTALVRESLALQRELGYERDTIDSLAVLGHVACLQGNYPQAITLLDESLALARGRAYILGIARALDALGVTAFQQWRFDQARAYWEESLQLFEKRGDASGSASPMAGLGQLEHARGHQAPAESLLQRSLALSRQAGDRLRAAAILNSLSAVARAGGDLARARDLSVQALAVRKEAGARRGIAESLESLAAVARLRRQPARAIRLCAAAAALRDAVGSPHSPVERAVIDETTADARTQLGDAAFDAAWAEGCALSLEQVVAQAIDED